MMAYTITSYTFDAITIAERWKQRAAAFQINGSPVSR